MPTQQHSLYQNVVEIEGELLVHCAGQMLVPLKHLKLGTVVSVAPGYREVHGVRDAGGQIGHIVGFDVFNDNLEVVVQIGIGRLNFWINPSELTILR